jgi:hypothetical protein
MLEHAADITLRIAEKLHALSLRRYYELAQLILGTLH